MVSVESELHKSFTATLHSVPELHECHETDSSLTTGQAVLFCGRTSQSWGRASSPVVVKPVVLWSNENVPRQICHHWQKTRAVSELALQVLQNSLRNMLS